MNNPRPISSHAWRRPEVLLPMATAVVVDNAVVVPEFDDPDESDVEIDNAIGSPWLQMLVDEVLSTNELFVGFYLDPAVNLASLGRGSRWRSRSPGAFLPRARRRRRERSCGSMRLSGPCILHATR